MRDYGRVAPTFWTRGSGKKLRGNPNAQIVALYLFTCPSASMIGLYHLAIPTMAHETGLTVEEARNALADVCELGVAQYDEDEELVYLPEGARYQIGEQLKAGDKRVKGVEAAVAQFGRHAFAADFINRYRALFCMGLEAPSAPAPHPFRRDPVNPGSPFEGASKGMQDRGPTPSEGVGPTPGSPLEARQGKEQDQARIKQSQISLPSIPGARDEDDGRGGLQGVATAEVLLAAASRHPMLRTLHGDRSWAVLAASGLQSQGCRAADADAAVDAFVASEAAKAPDNFVALDRWVRENIGRYISKAKRYGDEDRNRQEKRAVARPAFSATRHRGPMPQPGPAWIDPAEKNPNPATPEEQETPLV